MQLYNLELIFFLSNGKEVWKRKKRREIKTNKKVIPYEFPGHPFSLGDSDTMKDIIMQDVMAIHNALAMTMADGVWNSMAQKQERCGIGVQSNSHDL